LWQFAFKLPTSDAQKRSTHPASKSVATFWRAAVSC
jgi:hypothetical protein